MPKRNTSARQTRRPGSRALERSGLIANADTQKRSASTKCALDNRSHRTPQLSCERIHKMQRRSRCFHSSFVSFNAR